MKRSLLITLALIFFAAPTVTTSASAQPVSKQTRAHQHFAQKVSFALYEAGTHMREAEEQLAYALSAEPKELKLAAQWTQLKWEHAKASYENRLYKIKPPHNLVRAWSHYIAWQKQVIVRGFQEVAPLEAQNWPSYEQAVQRTNRAAQHREVFFKRLRVYGA
jgi:16S rRNA G1207 methylase RsmC